MHDSSRDAAVCADGGRKMAPEEGVAFQSTVYCEACCIALRVSHGRKTHWHYIASIKADYLIPGKDG